MQEYEMLVNVCKANNIKPVNFVDCGANIGLSSVFINHQFGNIQSICIEPDRSNVSQIEKNFKSNKLSQFKIYQQGLWNTKTTLY